MVRNIITLFLSLLLIVFFLTNKVSALKDKTCEYYCCDSEQYFLNDLGIDKLRKNFVDKFSILDADTEKNNILIKENKELNKNIKKRLEETKAILGHDKWKEIRDFKNQINDKKISTSDKIKELVNAQKKVVEIANYSDESISEYITVLINAQRLKRESIEFERAKLNEINELII